MNKMIFLNGSPKKRKAVSEKLLGMLKESIEGKSPIETIYLYETEFTEDIFDKVYGTEKIIIALPLYIDCLPSGVLEFFEGCLNYVKEKPGNSPKLYFIINCGFMEDRQNDTAIKILQKFADKAGFVFSGGISVGSGAMIINSNREPQLRLLIEDFGDKLLKDTVVYSAEIEYEKSSFEYFEVEKYSDEKSGFSIYRIDADMPRFLFKAKSNKVWIEAAEKRGLRKRDLKNKYYSEK